MSRVRGLAGAANTKRGASSLPPSHQRVVSQKGCRWQVRGANQARAICSPLRWRAQASPPAASVFIATLRLDGPIPKNVTLRANCPLFPPTLPSLKNLTHFLLSTRSWTGIRFDLYNSVRCPYRIGFGRCKSAIDPWSLSTREGSIPPSCGRPAPWAAFLWIT